MADKIYINLMPNDRKQPGDNQPAFVAPKNPKFPDKNWTLGVKIGNAWYNQAAFEGKDPETGQANGGIVVILTPSESKGTDKGNYKQQSLGGQNNFQKKPAYGNKQSYRY